MSDTRIIKSDAKPAAPSRRDLLKLGAVAPVLAVAAVGAPSTVAASAPQASPGCLQDTPETRAYYEAASF